MFNAPAISLVIYTYHICEPMPILSDQCVQVHMTGNDGTILQTEPHHCAGGCFSCVTTHNTDKISSSVYVSTCAASALFALPVTHCVSCKKATCFAIRQQSCLSPSAAQEINDKIAHRQGLPKFVDVHSSP
eukprot:scpid106056/ scgid3715/ 